MTSICISSGHGTRIRGASDILDEVNEATRIVDRIFEYLQQMGVQSWKFHDTTSTSQNQNLETIVNYHNSRPAHDWDYSIHFNAYEHTSKCMGCEVLFVSQENAAGELATKISDTAGFVNRGGKYRGDLYFLNQTRAKSLLLEICFVDSSCDATKYEE